jgi:hypothetical protein
MIFVIMFGLPGWLNGMCKIKNFAGPKAHFRNSFPDWEKRHAKNNHYIADIQLIMIVAPGLAIKVVINFMKTTLIFAALIIATISSRAAGYESYDPTDSGTISLSGNTVLGGNGLSTGVSITLTNFTGVVMDNLSVDLTWATMMESGVNYFAIERSADGINYQDIDSIKSKMNISTHDYQLLYNYTDAHPLTGTSYYRVKVVGKNGYINQSPVVLIRNSQADGTKIYPTIIQNNMVFVESEKNLRAAKIEFFDLSGKKISETNWATLSGTQNTQMSTSGSLPTGTYLARLTSNGQNVKTQLVIVQSH